MPYRDPCCDGLHAFNHLEVSTQTGAAAMAPALFLEHQSADKSCVNGSLSNASFRGVRGEHEEPHSAALSVWHRN
jgi:hypothetical protein